MSHLRCDTLEAAYKEACSGQNDIGEHLPTLRRLAERCRHVTEFGVRRGVSTVGLLMGLQSGRLVSYDTEPCVEAVARVTEWARGRFTFVQGDSLTCGQIDRTDLLLIDTCHNYAHCYAELTLHSERVKRYLILHDTETFGLVGDDKGPGLWAAVGRFLAYYPCWRVVDHFTNQHGLTVLERRGD